MNQDCSFSNVPKGFFRSSLEGKVIEADQCLVEMLGYESREELMRIDIARDFYVDPLMRLKLLTELSTDHKTHEFFCKHRDGRPIAIRMNFAAGIRRCRQFSLFRRHDSRHLGIDKRPQFAENSIQSCFTTIKYV